MKHPPKAATGAERRQVPRTHPALMVLQVEEGLDAPLRALNVLLAQALVAKHGDAVLVVHLEEPAPADSRWSMIAGPPSLSPSTSIAGPLSRTPSVEADAGRVDHLSLPVADDPHAASVELDNRLRQLFPRYAYIFVDPSARGSAFAHRLVDALGTAELPGIVRRLVYLGRNGGRAPALPGWSVLHTHLLPLAVERTSEPVSAGIRGRFAAVRKLAVALRERLGGAAIEPQGEPHPEARVLPEWCRVRLDLRAIARLPDPLFARVPAAEQASFARWARALTWRRVGVALGGSGSWGYAHIALLQELDARGIPVDLVGGSSSGSLMGAYYAVLGRSGLDLAIERGVRFSRLVWASTISSTVIDAGIDIDLGQAHLEELEVILLPVATNLSHARAEVITRSTVASAVRASGSAPGVFAATITRAGLYVDGAITDNVPVLLVERMGADLLIACNPLPPPPSVRVRTPGTPLDDFLAEFNLLDRLRDLWVSFELMFHDFGDCELTDTRVVYEPPAQAHALFRTFNFAEAEDLVAAVKREDAFRETVQRSAAAWEALARARGPA